MSADILPATDVVANNDINPTITSTPTAPTSITNNDQTEASTSNGLLHSNGTNINSVTSSEPLTEGQVESTKNNTYNDNGQSTSNKNDLEPEAL
ncbi:unnamed protein product, partial [Adineta steineri]